MLFLLELEKIYLTLIRLKLMESVLLLMYILIRTVRVLN